MEKNDVLRKAQNEGKDEREEEVKTRAFHIGWLCVSTVIVFLYIWRGIHDEPATDIFMILIAQSTANSLYQYFKLPEKKSYFAAGILGIIAFGMAFASLLSQYGVY